MKSINEIKVDNLSPLAKRCLQLPCTRLYQDMYSGRPMVELSITVRHLVHLEAFDLMPIEVLRGFNRIIQTEIRHAIQAKELLLNQIEAEKSVI